MQSFTCLPFGGTTLVQRGRLLHMNNKFIHSLSLLLRKSFARYYLNFLFNNRFFLTTTCNLLSHMQATKVAFVYITTSTAATTINYRERGSPCSYPQKIEALYVVVQI